MHDAGIREAFSSQMESTECDHKKSVAQEVFRTSLPTCHVIDTAAKAVIVRNTRGWLARARAPAAPKLEGAFRVRSD